MDCPDCGEPMDLTDRTESNVTTKRAYPGQHTGDIYSCEKCETKWLDDFLDGKVRSWHG